MSNFFKSIEYKYYMLAAFLLSAIVEFIARQSGGYTLAGLIFYGIYNIVVYVATLIYEHEKNN